jgi:hypothetical protein
MGKLKSERHHWWPECVSARWVNADGGTHWIRPDGATTCTTPNNFGVIGNGHFIKMGDDPAESTPWDENFEREFQHADESFPALIDWMDRLERVGPPFERPVSERVTRVVATDEQFATLLQCIVSLVVRSPKHREGAAALAEDFRHPLEQRERNRLIGANMRRSQRNAVKALGARGKAMIIFSPESEFIFGDGFYNNLSAPVQHLYNPKMLVPITPWMSVLYTRPMSYRPEPRLVTLVATANETQDLNYAVQVYARNAIFYRSERPEITDAFAQGRHLVFRDYRNSVEQLIHSIPGVPPRDTSLDWLSDYLS